MRFPENPPADFSADRRPSDVVPYPPADADISEAIRAALNSHRPIVVIFPGEPTFDADGLLGMSQPRIVHPGEAEPVEGQWKFDDVVEGEDPTISSYE
jgi:hypothetical protein